MDTSCWMDRRRRRNLVRILSLFRYTSQLDALFTHTSLKVTDVNVLRRSRKQWNKSPTQRWRGKLVQTCDSNSMKRRKRNVLFSICIFSAIYPKRHLKVGLFALLCSAVNHPTTIISSLWTDDIDSSLLCRFSLFESGVQWAWKMARSWIAH